MDNRSQPGRRAGEGSLGSEFNSSGSGAAGFGSGKAASNVSLQPTLGDDASEAAGDVASEATNVAASIAADLKDAATAASRAVKQQASEFAASVGQELSKTAENQKARGVDTMQCFARAITSAAAELENQSPRVAQSVRDAAKKVEGFSENISSRNVDELVKAAAELARSQPMIFIGGAVAAGFALSRFLKSSATNQSAARYQSSMQAHS